MLEREGENGVGNVKWGQTQQAWYSRKRSAEHSGLPSRMRFDKDTPRETEGARLGSTKRQEREREGGTHTHTHTEGIKQKNICERILSDLGEKFCFKVHSLGPPYQCPGSSGHFEPSAALFSSPLWLTPKPQGLIKCL